MLEKQNDNFQFIFPMAQCYKHPKLGAVAICSRCGEPICKKCYLNEIRICTKCRNQISAKRSVAFLIEILVPIWILYLLGVKHPFFFVCLYLLLKDGFNGQSLFKKVFKLKVVDMKSGVPCRIWQSCVRNAIFIIPFSLIIEYTIMNYSSNLRRLGDVIARTKVIEVQ